MHSLLNQLELHPSTARSTPPTSSHGRGPLASFLPSRTRPSVSPCLLSLLFVLLACFTHSAQAGNGNTSGSSDGTCDLTGIADATGKYDTLRVASIFVILCSSSIGMILPFIPRLASSTSSKASRARRIGDETFFILKYVGAGVVVATGFVHLAYESIVELESPCLNLIYQPLAPVLQMVGLALVFLIDCFVARYLHRLRKKNQSNLEEAYARQANALQAQLSNRNGIDRAATCTTADNGRYCNAPPSYSLTSGSNENSDQASSDQVSFDSLEKEKDLARIENERLDEKTRELEVMIIEGGIVFHSMIVGIGLGTSSDNGFIPYFVAITFHQFFDGVAIGTRMASLNFIGKRTKQFLLFLAYSLVTPCGISIGVGVRKTFQPNDPSTILTIGILDSISAGVLLYGALVDMIANDFLHGEMLEASTPRIWTALISVLIGAIIMSILGQWA